MRKSSFKKHLDSLSHEELKEEMNVLYDKIPAIKEYYKIELGSDIEREKIHLATKKNLASCFATRSKRRPRRPRIKKMRSLLKEATKKSIYDHELADIKLYTVETALQFNADYRFYSETLHNNIIRLFEESLHLIRSSLTEDLFDQRINDVVNNRLISYDIRIDLNKVKESFG